MNEPNLSDPTEASSDAGTRGKRVGKFTPEQWAGELNKLGWKDGNKELKGPKAFELPGFPNSQPKQD